MFMDGRRRIGALLAVCVSLVLGACANHHLPMFGADSGPLQVKNTFTPAALQPVNPRQPIYLLVHDYDDSRAVASARRIGQIRDTFVSDMTGTEVVIDEDVAAFVTSAMKRQLAAAGYQVLSAKGAGGEPATFVIKGRVNKLALDVLARDKVNIEVQTVVTDPRNGEVVWSGTVKEQNERFAGVSGNSRASLVSYLDESLRHVTRKTVTTITASLAQSLPDLFLQAGVPTPGVTVHAAPHAGGEGHSQAPAAMPVEDTGTLSIETMPVGVQIYVGDVYYGQSPLSLKLAPGVYSVRLAANGYKDITQKISVRPGETTDWHVNMQR